MAPFDARRARSDLPGVHLGGELLLALPAPHPEFTPDLTRVGDVKKLVKDRHFVVGIFARINTRAISQPHIR